ncbi:MAG: MBL fold metallo-hydrolase [Candidatus Pacearchaeota archaeon]
MRFAALSSGSCGNCFYVSEGDNAVLIDAGISCKQILSRLDNLGENSKKIKGIFLSHEHIDHIKGVDVLARTLQVPIFATSGTLKSEIICTQENLLNNIKNDETIKLGKMEISAFSKSHDASQPVSFQIRNGKTISIITDIGHACKNVQEAVQDSDFLVMESNHDIKMLENGPYPHFLKKRILGDKGHLSNLHSSLCVLEYSSSKLKNLMLAHLSEKNNTSKLALSCFRNLLKERKDLNPNLLLSERNVCSDLISV